MIPGLAAYSVLLVMALWFCLRIGKGAVMSVGVYRFSRRARLAVPPHDVCGDPKCPALVLISAVEDTHREVRTEAILAVGESLALIAAVTYTLGFFLQRLF